jgi:phosphatidylserine/phosphatidylglycerophosphate/cardiolipin synthase-like enzyme
MNFGRRSARRRVYKFVAALIFAAFFIYTNLSARPVAHEAEVTFLGGKDLFMPLIQDIDEARASVKIAIYMFKTDRKKPADTEFLLDALVNAVQRGVDVSVIFDVEKREDSFLTKANRETGAVLEKAGAKVYYDDPSTRLHAKMTVIDSRIVYAGSHNYTYSAFNYNNEVTFRMVSEDLAHEAEQYLENLL